VTKKQCDSPERIVRAMVWTRLKKQQNKKNVIEKEWDREEAEKKRWSK
jgi:hypothetical protein